MPLDACVERGLKELDKAKSENCTPVRKKSNSMSILSTGLKEVASALAAPIKIAADTFENTDAFKQFDLSDRTANTIQNLMYLASNLLQRISEADKIDETEFAVILRARLSTVRQRIDLALENPVVLHFMIINFYQEFQSILSLGNPSSLIDSVMVVLKLYISKSLRSRWWWGCV